MNCGLDNIKHILHIEYFFKVKYPNNKMVNGKIRCRVGLTLLVAGLIGIGTGFGLRSYNDKKLEESIKNGMGETYSWRNMEINAEQEKYRSKKRGNEDLMFYSSILSLLGVCSAVSGYKNRSYTLIKTYPWGKGGFDPDWMDKIDAK